MVKIVEHDLQHEQDVVDLILNIQQNEFGVPVTLKDQPDLLKVKEFYQQGNGNFWVAVEDEKLIGTIALVDMKDGNVALRKMFVEAASRGKEKGVAALLLQKAFDWCHDRKIQNIYLGTVEVLKASHRFYEKNGFVRVEIKELPASYPRMPVDTIFYQYSFVK